jgi:CHASE1-domain containing sensor protein
MGVTLMLCVIAFTVVYVALLRSRIRLEQMADRVVRLQQEIVG